MKAENIGIKTDRLGVLRPVTSSYSIYKPDQMGAIRVLVHEM